MPTLESIQDQVDLIDMLTPAEQKLKIARLNHELDQIIAERKENEIAMRHDELILVILMAALLIVFCL